MSRKGIKQLMTWACLHLLVMAAAPASSSSTNDNHRLTNLPARPPSTTISGDRISGEGNLRSADGLTMTSRRHRRSINDPATSLLHSEATVQVEDIGNVDISYGGINQIPGGIKTVRIQSLQFCDYCCKSFILPSIHCSPLQNTEARFRSTRFQAGSKRLDISFIPINTTSFPHSTP